MGLINLTVYPRSTTGKNENRRTRNRGRTPAVVYGNERDGATNMEFDTYQLNTALTKAGSRSSLFMLTVDGEAEPFTAVLREIQRHPVRDEIFHCDLLEIPRGVPMKTDVFIDYVGENKAIKTGTANLEIIERNIEVECLPRNMPDSVTIDISNLEIGDKVTAGDLEIENSTILTDPESILVKLNPNIFVALTDDEDAASEDEGAATAADDGTSSDGDS